MSSLFLFLKRILFASLLYSAAVYSGPSNCLSWMVKLGYEDLIYHLPTEKLENNLEADASIAFPKTVGKHLINPAGMTRLKFIEQGESLMITEENVWEANDYVFFISQVNRRLAGNKKLISYKNIQKCLIPEVNDMNIRLYWGDCIQPESNAWTFGEISDRHPEFTQICLSQQYKFTIQQCLSRQKDGSIQFDDRYINLAQKKENKDTIFFLSDRYLSNIGAFVNTGLCMGIYRDMPFELQTPSLLPCNADHVDTSINQIFVDNAKSWMILSFFMTKYDPILGTNFVEEQCLSSINEKIVFEKCDLANTSQHWRYDKDVHRVYNKSSSKCITRHPDNQAFAVSLILEEDCHSNNAYQDMTWVEKKYRDEQIGFLVVTNDSASSRHLYATSTNTLHSKIFLTSEVHKAQKLDIIDDRWFLVSPEDETFVWYSNGKSVELSAENNLKKENFYQYPDYSIHISEDKCLVQSAPYKVNIDSCEENHTSWSLLPIVLSN